jgi:hypothetical protein
MNQHLQDIIGQLHQEKIYYPKERNKILALLNDISEKPEQKRKAAGNPKPGV